MSAGITAEFNRYHKSEATISSHPKDIKRPLTLEKGDPIRVIFKDEDKDKVEGAFQRIDYQKRTLELSFKDHGSKQYQLDEVASLRRPWKRKNVWVAFGAGLAVDILTVLSLRHIRVGDGASSTITF